jgi:PAS domain S-box-containing protein
MAEVVSANAPAPLRILLVEDSPYDAELITRELVNNGLDFELSRVQSADELQSALRGGTWDVILCDYRLPSFDGRAALALVQRHESDAVFVLLSGSIGEEAVADLLREGVRDCVLKDNLSRLGPVLRRELAEAESRRLRVAAEQALQATTEALRGVFDSAPVAIVATDTAERVTMWNPAAEEMFGWRVAEVTGEKVANIPVEEEASWREMQRRALAGESFTDVESTRLHRDGTPVPVTLAVTPLRDGDERIFAVMTTLADLSAHVLARRALEENYALLSASDRQRKDLLGRLVRAQEEERQRIANDIHDDSVQVLTALALRLDILRRRLDEPALLEMLVEIEQTARQSIQRLRHLIFELRPPALDQDGLDAALRQYLEQTKQMRNLDYTLETRVTAEASSETRAILYRISQEAVFNVVKHANASHVAVHVEDRDDGFLVRIEDDGVGFTPEETSEQPGHLGLTSMRERAEMTGGWLRLDSAPGAGTRVEFLIPDGHALERVESATA